MGKKAFATQATFATATLAGLSILQGSAQAQPRVDWTGFYIGGQVGWGWQDVEYKNPVFRGDADLDGFAAGAIVGYNVQVAPQFVLGVEGTFGFTGLNEQKLIAGTELRSRTPYDYSGRFRAGYLIKPQKLLFVSAGFAGAQQEVSFPGLSESLNRTGYTVGFGVEKGDFIKGAHFRLEYNYKSFGTKTFFGDLPVNLNQHLITLGVSTTPEKVGIFNGRR